MNSPKPSWSTLSRSFAAGRGVRKEGYKKRGLPAIGDRFFIYYPQTVPNPGYPQAGPQELKVHYAGINNSFEPSSGRSRQYAVRYSMSWDGWDTAVSYFPGMNTPLFPREKLFPWIRRQE